MGGGAGRWVLLWVPFLGAVAAAGNGGGRPPPEGEDPLSRLGRAAWAGLEGCLGPHPLQLVAESLSATLWLVSSGISAALATLCGLLGDLLAAAGFSGEAAAAAAAWAPGPGAVQRVLPWALAAAGGCWVLPRLCRALAPALRWAKLGCFLGAFLRVAASPEPPTAKAALLLALWVLHALLGRLGAPPAPGPPLDAAVRSLEWKVEELRRRQRWGGPRNQEE